MKPITFLGDSRSVLQHFPDAARYQAGVELRAVQEGLDPNDWKPMRTVGPGVREVRIRDVSGAFRIIYLANPIGLRAGAARIPEEDTADRSHRHRAGRQAAQGLAGTT